VTVVFERPVRGSVFLERCTNCVVHLACRQLRIKDCTNCTVYACTASIPVIEDSTGMKFAGFDATFLPPATSSATNEASAVGADGEAEAAAAGGQIQQPPSLLPALAVALSDESVTTATGAAAVMEDQRPWAAERLASSFKHIDDFTWLRASASPHWALLPLSAWRGAPAACQAVLLQRLEKFVAAVAAGGLAVDDGFEEGATRVL
jgi:hypothetical protein